MKTQPASDVVVVGGGIIGLATAWELAHRGCQVEILEADDFARAASHAAAGMLAPLVEAEQLDSFFDCCRGSRDAWQSWAQELTSISGLNLDYDRSGALVLPGKPLSTQTDSDLPADLQELVERAGAADEPVEILDRQEVHDLVPDLGAAIEHGLHLPGEHRIDNRKACQALLRACQQSGVVMSPQHRVQQLSRRSGKWHLQGHGWYRETAQVVITAGAWSGQIDGLPCLPVQAVRGQMFELGDVHWPWTGSVRAAEGYAVRRHGGRLLVGATVEPLDGFEAHTTPEGLHQLLEFSRGIFPGLEQRPWVDAWAGLRPTTPDRRPIIGRLDEDLWVATGHFRNGILLAPWTGQHLASAIVEGNLLPTEFAPERFATNRIPKSRVLSH